MDDKPGSLREAFSMWQRLIDSKEQVVMGIPSSISEGQGIGLVHEDKLEEYLKKLVIDSVLTHRSSYKENISDPEFIEWALSDNSQIRFFSNRTQSKPFYTANKFKRWRAWGKQAAAGTMPEVVVRTITIEKR